MPVIHLLIDEKLEEIINELIRRGYFEDKAQVIHTAIELLANTVVFLEKLGEPMKLTEAIVTCIDMIEKKRMK